MPGSFDPYWIVTQSPNTAIATPATPYVLSNNTVWGQSTFALKSSLEARSRYLSPFNTQSYTVNNPVPDSAFKFKLDFCVCSAGDYEISGLFNADDEAELYLDGTILIASTNSSTIPSGYHWQYVDSFYHLDYLSAGSHFLQIRLRNTGGQAMGAALAGRIKSASSNALLNGFACCNPRGAIAGHKYIDKNCNGIIDGSDSLARNWTFNISPSGPNGSTATTDALGFFSFPSLSPGTYTLSEVVQPGWTPVLPAGGTTTVTVVVGQTTTVDFLNSNCQREEPCNDKCYWRITGNNIIDPKINYLGTNNKADLIIKTDGTERARIQGFGNGNMGIATPSPTTTFHTFAAPPEGVPSGVRFEELPSGAGYVLVIDDAGYIYKTRGFQEKGTNNSTEFVEMKQEINALKNELAELKSMLRGDNSNSLKVSPNPTNGQINATFHISGAYTSATIQVVDMAGKVVMSHPVTGNDGIANLSIPLSTSSGNLICRLVVDNKQVAVQRIALLNN